MKKALFLRHLAFEDAGNLAEVLRRRDYRIEYIEAGAMDLKSINPLEPDLLVSLGGPISANDEPVFPFLADERTILGKRMRADRPTLGICLGAQIMARE